MNVRRSEGVTRDDRFQKRKERIRGVAAARIYGHFSSLNEAKNCLLSMEESI